MNILDAIDEADRYLDLAQRADDDMTLCQRRIQRARNLLAPHVKPQQLLREAAHKVVALDWSDNDPDAVEAIEQLRKALDLTPPT